jgi:hypothetical protein
MHQYFADKFNGLELGIRHEERARLAVDGGGGSAPVHKPTPTKTHEVKVDGHTKTVPVTPKHAKPVKPTYTADDKAKEAIKDGAISTDEQALLKKSSPVRDAVKGQQAALKKVVDPTISHPVSTYSTYSGGSLPQSVQTDHEKLVAKLTDEKGSKGLDALDQQIADLRSAGATSGADALQKVRDSRASDEAKVADVVKSKTALLGTYKADKAGLTDAAPSDAADDYQSLRTDAQKWIDQFNDNDGQYYGGGMHWGDAWDTEKVDFDKLAKRFHDDPSELDNFAKSQGKDDSDLRDTSLEDHLADLADDDPELAGKVSLRYQAATELTDIMKRYNTARDAVDANKDASSELDDNIATLESSIKSDRAALSTETITDLDASLESTPGIITKPEPTSTSGDSNAPHKPAPSDPSGKDEPIPRDDYQGPTKTIKRTLPVDYTTKANRAKVIAQATKRNLLPSEHTTFDKQGNAVYTVQPNDSYWRIADMSDGKPAGAFDLQHFQTAVNENSRRLGRDPQVGMLYANDQVTIPNRSIADLVRLLDLPRTEEVDQQVPAYMGRANDPRMM